MTLNDMRSLLGQLETLVDGWGATGEIPQIERDLALDKLRRLYDLLRTVEIPPHTDTVQELDINLDDVLSVGGFESASDDVTEDAQPAPVADLPAEPEPAVSVEPESVCELEPEVAEEPKSVCEPEPEVSEELESVIAEQTTSDTANASSEPDAPLASEAAPVRPKPEATPAPTLFGVDDSDALLRHRHKQRVLMSLYDIEEPAKEPVEYFASAPVRRAESIADRNIAEEYAEEPEAPTPFADEPPTGLTASVEEEDDMMIEEIDISGEEPEGEEEPAEGAVLGEVLNHSVQTLGDRLTATGPGRKEPVADLVHSIEINDRFLMIRDLFGGDGAAYDRAIAQIDAFGDLDDCMIHIAENYAWNPNSDGAKLLMELLDRKFSRS